MTIRLSLCRPWFCSLITNTHRRFTLLTWYFVDFFRRKASERPGKTEKGKMVTLIIGWLYADEHLKEFIRRGLELEPIPEEWCESTIGTIHETTLEQVCPLSPLLFALTSLDRVLSQNQAEGEPSVLVDSKSVDSRHSDTGTGNWHEEW